MRKELLPIIEEVMLVGRKGAILQRKDPINTTLRTLIAFLQMLLKDDPNALFEMTLAEGLEVGLDESF